MSAGLTTQALSLIVEPRLCFCFLGRRFPVVEQ